MKRTIVSLTLLLALIATPALADGAYRPRNTPVPVGDWGINLVEDFSTSGDGLSRITADKPNAESFLCARIGEAPCIADADTSLRGVVLLPTCSEAPTDPCIDGLSMASAGATLQPAQFVGAVAPSRASQPEVGLPTGGSPSKWTAAGVPNAAGTDTYLVFASLRAEYQRETSRFNLRDLRVQVLPYSVISGDFRARFMGQGVEQGTGRNFVFQAGDDPQCAWTDAGVCGRTEDFVDGTRVQVSLRVPASVTGWLRGRLTTPEVSVNPISTSMNLLTVAGTAVDVPKFYGQATMATASEALRALEPKWQANATSHLNTQQLGEGNSMLIIDAFREYVGDRAAGRQRLWSFQSVSSGAGSGCLQDTTKLLGLVTTNAMDFDGAAPAFDGSVLNYRVSGMHYAADGSVQQGTYDLAMRSETARCLYGFSSAPLSASISIVYGDSSTIVATQTVSEGNGWLRLSAAGFTFSNPTIRVKLQQQAPVRPTPSTRPTPPPAKASSVRCVKGKQVKTFKAKQCPKGWKQSK